MVKKTIKRKNENQNSYVMVVAIVAVVAIVVLVLGGNAPLEGNVIETYVAPCEDSDPTNDYYTFGVAKHGHQVEYDYCAGDKLFQFTCVTSNTLKMTSGYDCAKGCERGMCLN